MYQISHCGSSPWSEWSRFTLKSPLLEHPTTVEHGQLITKKYLGGHKVTRTTIPRFNFMVFYAFKMAVAIESLRGFAVEAV